MVLLGTPVFLLQKHGALYSGKKFVLSDIIIFQLGNIFFGFCFESSNAFTKDITLTIVASFALGA